MDNITIQATEYTPAITLSHNQYFIELIGDSRPENVQIFYEPIIKWVDDYASYLFFMKDKSEEEITTNCNFKLDYFNSSSAKYIKDIIDQLVIAHNFDGLKLVINWFYDVNDEDLKAAGEEFEELFDTNFRMIPVNN